MASKMAKSGPILEFWAPNTVATLSRSFADSHFSRPARNFGRSTKIFSEILTTTVKCQLMQRGRAARRGGFKFW